MLELKKIANDAIVVSKNELDEVRKLIKKTDKKTLLVLACAGVVLVGCTCITICAVKRHKKLKEDEKDFDFDFEDCEIDL